MRSRKNQLWVAISILVLAGGILTAVLLRRRAAPDAVRLLPESDAVLYLNAEPIRLLTGLGKTVPKERDPQYDDFVQQTGFEFERDLDKAALAIHYGVQFKGRATETRYSEILQGRFDSARVSAYLGKLAAKTERYQNYDIYEVPIENRTVRVALLGFDIAAASNHRPLQAGCSAVYWSVLSESVLAPRPLRQRSLDNRAPTRIQRLARPW
jgi:hypothetical protein